VVDFDTTVSLIEKHEIKRKVFTTFQAFEILSKIKIKCSKSSPPAAQTPEASGRSRGSLWTW
jgi:hypothetical protein